MEQVRGDALVNVQQISEQRYLLTTDFKNERNIRLVDLGNQTNEEIVLPDVARGKLSSALLLSTGEIALGLTDNGLVVGKLDYASNTISDVKVLENKHNAPVTSLLQDESGRLISLSNAEPVARIWQKAEGQWQYLAYLAGVPKNLSNVHLIGNGYVVGVDVQGNGMAWDVERQMQRARMELASDTGDKAKNFAPVQQVGLGKFDGTGLAIDANGSLTFGV